MSSFKIDRRNYFRLLQYLKPYRHRFTGGILASIPAASMEGALAWGVGPFLDHIVKTENYDVLIWVPVAVIGMSLLQGIFLYISGYCMEYTGLSVTRDIRVDLFNSLSRMDLAYFRKNDSGELYTRYVQDPVALQTVIVQNLQGFAVQFFNLLFLAGVLFYRNWLLAIIAISIISTIVIPLHIISKKVRGLDHEVRVHLKRMINVFNESMNGAKVIIGFELQSLQERRFQQVLNEYFGTNMRSIKAGGWGRPLMQIIAAVGVATIIVIGGLAVKNKQMSPGELASFMMALILLYKPIKTMGSLSAKTQRLMAPMERVFEVMDRQPKLKEKPDAVDVGPFESLRFEHVDFGYLPGQRILEDIGFEVRAGEMIAFVGESGGGKSTLVDLIPRFIDPTAGRVLFNGVDLRDLSFSSFRSQISFVSQDTTLFDLSLQKNIAWGRPDATEEDIWRVVEAAQLKSFVESLPEGLKTQVGKNGQNLSGGQRQRVAIARALLKDAPILIMDEATSALDNESEAKVQEAMSAAFQGRTVFVIAHRLSTIQAADRIFVVDGGRIAESGTHEELIKKESLYKNLYMLQFRHLDLKSTLTA